MMADMSESTATWLVVADASGARVFTFEEKNGPWTLVEELRGDGSGHPDQSGDFGKKASEHKGALHGHGEQNPKETTERRFAHTLAHVLERGLSSNRFAKLALVAPPKLLGDLRENLSRSLQATLVGQVHKDYVHFNVNELKEHLRADLPV
jgi:protein required for attachment to host cells